MTLPKEAIEAGLRTTLSSVNMPAGECLHETDVSEVLEAALPFLSPIAGKPDMLRLAVAAVLEADKEFRANMPPEWEGDPLSDEIDGLRRVYSALVSSPGKDGGQEVEAVAHIVTDPKGKRRVTLATQYDPMASSFWERGTMPTGYSVTPLYTRPQPASTALVERLEAGAWPIDTDDQVEALARECDWDNRKYMTPKDYAIWCERMRKFARLAALSVPAAAVVGEPVVWTTEANLESAAYDPELALTMWGKPTGKKPVALYREPIAAPSAPDGWQETIEKVLASEADFRSNMPADWQGDPLSDAIAELRAALGGKP